MKKIALFICCLPTMFILHAQDKLISLGKADKSELELKDCDFDPGASNECLINLGEVTYSLNGVPTVRTEIRKRIKVFKESAISDVADVKISYYSKDANETISGIDGYVYNEDASGNITTTKLKKSDIFDKKLDENYSQISFALPDVHVGSVVEYRYISYRKSFWSIRSWFFQQQYPVKYSAYNLIVPDYFDFTYQVNRRQDITIKKSSDQDGNWFIMKNIAGMHEEPYMAGKLDFLQRIDFNLASITPPGEATIDIGTNWKKQIEDYLNTYEAGGQLKRNIHHPEDLDAAVALCKSDKEKLNTVYKYVQSHMKCNDDKAIYSENGGIKDAWDKKQGSVADINFLLINLLHDFKINAYPLLVSTHENGTLTPAYVDLGQFDAVYVYAEADNVPYIMNAAEKNTPYDMIPFNVNFTSAIIADNKNLKWIDMGDARKKYTRNGIINLNVEKDGKLSGFANLSFKDYARIKELQNVKDDKINSQFSLDKNINLKVDSFDVQNEDDNSKPLIINLNLEGVAKNSGNYLLIPYNIYSGLTENPFTADKRQTLIQLDVLRSYNISGYINIPEGFTIEELPKNINMRIGDSSIFIKRLFQKNTENMIAYSLSVNFLAPTYPLDEYPDIKEFYKKLFEILDEQVVLKRVQSNQPKQDK